MQARPGETAPPPLTNGEKDKGTGGKTSTAGSRPPSFHPEDPASPTVILQTRVNGTANPNEEVTYRLLVSNPTAGHAHKVQVRQTVPAQGKYIRASPPPTTQSPTELIWQLGTLNAFTNKEIQVVFKADGGGDLESTARVQFEYGQTVVTKMESALQMRMGTNPESSTDLLEGQTMTLTTGLRNNGTTPIENIVLTQTIPEGLEFLTCSPNNYGDRTNPLEWRIPKLDPGKETSVNVQVLAKKTGTYSSKASAMGGAHKKDDQLIIKVGNAALEITGGGPDRRVVGRPATYFITVVNRGTIPTTNVKITSLISKPLEFISADSGGAMVKDEARWLIPSLGVGEKRTVSMVLRSIESKGVILRAEVIADRLPEGKQLEKLTKFYPPEGLMVEVDKLIEPVNVGDQTSFRVKLLNYGSQTYKGAIVTITLPTEMQLLSAQGMNGQSMIGPAPSGQTAVFAPIATLAPNQEPSFQVYGKVIKMGEPRLRVLVKAPELPGGELVFEEGIHLANPTSSTPSVPNAANSDRGLSSGTGLPRFP